MKNKKNVELLYPMLYFSLLALAACLLLSTPAESIAGLGRILTSPSQLTKDYFKLGGFGGTFLNVALMGLAYTAIHAFSGTTLNGMSLIAFFLPLGFGFFGLNILNIWPGFIGTWLFVKATRQKFSSLANVSILSGALGPIVSELLFRYPVTALGLPDLWIVRIALALFFGCLAGFCMPSLYNNSPNLHKWYSLYNASPAAGLIAIAFTSILFRCTGVEYPTNFDVGASHRLVVMVFSVLTGLGFVAIGYFVNSKSFKGYAELARGCSHGNDLTAEFGCGLTIVNIGTMTLGYIAYYNLVGSDMMTGPTMGAVICALACTGMGGHIVNVIPIMTGYVLTSALASFHVNDQPILVGLAYAASMSPISGHYGAFFGVLAGMLHCAIVQSVITFHHGFSVLNGGFTSCIVTMMIIPLLQTFFEKRDCVGLFPKRKKF